MGMIRMATAFASLALLACGSAHAASSKICSAYAMEAAAKAQGAMDLNCGVDQKDPRWTLDRKAHARWCRSASDADVAAEAAARRQTLKVCETCTHYAYLGAAASAKNAKLGCGFTGPRWTAAESEQLQWCLSQRDETKPPAMTLKAAFYREGAAGLQRIVECESSKTGTKVPPAQGK